MTDKSEYSAFKTPLGQSKYFEAYDDVLRDWPVAFEELDIQTTWGRTHVIASGSPESPPLLLLPSMSGSATMWRPNIAELSKKFRVYAVDVIGQAGKSILISRKINRKDLADWIVEILNALDAQKTAIVGSSYGGFLAVNQARFTPERIGKMVLISPAGVFAGGLFRIFLRGMLSRFIKGNKERKLTDLLGGGAVIRQEDKKWEALMELTIKESARPILVPPVVYGKTDLLSIDIPTLLLIGEKEILYNPGRTLKKAAKMLPVLSGDIIPGAHHLANLACPDIVNRKILDFLA